MFFFYKIKLIIKQEGRDVYKYLFELEDGNKIETVLMLHNYGISICVSSQGLLVICLVLFAKVED